MERMRNELLAAWMAEKKVTAGELSSLVNTAIADLTGTYGSTNERAVFRWLSGKTTWPNARQRVALERVTERRSEEIGFCRRGRQPALEEDEDSVYRRAFLAAATSAGASIAAHPAVRRLGSTDVDGLRARLAAWIQMDNRYGGTPELEELAAQFARSVGELQQGATASQRVRSELYSVAATSSNNAMWAAINNGRLDAALRHMQQTVTLAGLANDPATSFRVWGHAAFLYKQRGQHTDALAASEVSRRNPITRRDPLFASMAMARLAGYNAQNRDPKAALRHLSLAQEALGRADLKMRRPVWVGFYDQAELDHLAMVAHLNLHRWADAERHAHRSFAHLRPGMERNRALLHANLALAQLGQGDLEPAIASAQRVPQAMINLGRIRGLLNEFGTRLNALAPRSREARTWQTYKRTVAA